MPHSQDSEVRWHLEQVGLLSSPGIFQQIIKILNVLPSTTFLAPPSAVPASRSSTSVRFVTRRGRLSPSDHYG